MTEKIIAQVWCAKARNAKLISVPKKCDIKTGDYVELVKVK